MNQTRLGSLLEVMANIATGMVVSWLLTIYALPLWGFNPSAKQAVGMTIMYTIVSLIRSYFWRRLFNSFVIKKHKKKMQLGEAKESNAQ